jgi:simple sugar transport system substrate-binding protein
LSWLTPGVTTRGLGNYVIFKGPIADNKGSTVIAACVSRGQTDPELEKMSYLVEGVIGATS